MEEDRHTYNNGSYDDPEKRRNPLINIFKWLLIILVILIIIILLLTRCTGKVNYDDLLNAGKKYFALNTSEMPKYKGECNIVNLNTLKEEKLLDNKAYDTCDNDTYVKVCALESGNKQYTPVLNCKNEVTKFDNYKEGVESDLIKDSSDVTFTYQATRGGIKLYYPNDVKDNKQVNEYYTSSPKEGYIYKDSEADVSKYYKTVTSKVYYNNGQLSSVAPNGYPNSEGKVSRQVYSDNIPTGNYSKVTLYRTYKMAYIYKYACTNEGGTLGIKYTSVPCSQSQDSLTQFVIDKFQYTCGKQDENGAYILTDRYTKCSNDTSEWTETACKTQEINGIGCESKTSYKYTANFYKWYKNVTTNYYYPNDKNKNEVNTYYVNSPQEGYIKDESSTTKGYKYYKLVDDKGNAITSESGLSITEGYVSLEDFIKSCKDLGYDVGSLEDINQIEDITYEIKIQYKNRV